MCEHGDLVKMELLISPPNRHGRSYQKPVGVDRCIASLVRVLNDGGVETISSCCGHGKMHGSIILADGRWLVVMSDKDAMVHFDKFPVTIHGEPRPITNDSYLFAG